MPGCLAVTAGLVRGPLRADRPDKRTDAPMVVPFEMLPSNHMVVRAKLNGKGPYRLIFDLGSPVTLLGGKTAEETGAIPKDAPRAILFGVRGEGKLKTVEVGGLTARDVPVVVMDHPALKALAGFLGKPLDGIMGYTFFAHYRTTIDYKAREMTFVPVEFEVKDLIKDIQERMLGPKVARERVLEPHGLWGLSVGAPEGGVDSPGVPITVVRTGSPAAAAGLKVGDVLTSLDGRWTASIADAYAAAATVSPGTAVPVVILRDGHEQTVTVTPVEGL
jgi:hypothetical protein